MYQSIYACIMYAYMYVYWHCNLTMCVELFHTAQTIENDRNLKSMQGTRASLAEAVFAATEFWQFKKPQGWCTNWKLKAGIAEKMCFRRLLLTALGLMLPSNQVFLVDSVCDTLQLQDWKSQWKWAAATLNCRERWMVTLTSVDTPIAIYVHIYI